MHGRGWALALGLGVVLLSTAAVAGPDPKPTVVDIKPFKDSLLVFQDGKGGTYVVLRNATGKGDKRVWYGSGKILYEQRTIGGSSNGDAWSISLWAPRLTELHSASVSRKADGTFEKSCWGRDEAVLTQLTGDKAKTVLDQYAIMTQASMRRPYILARDDMGIYYYVDMLMTPNADLHRGTAHRVFVGKKGAVKQLALTDVASDSAGDVFSTKTGDLRLVTEGSKQAAKWIKGGKGTELVWLDLHVNSRLIFSELGVYTFIGSVCENI